MKNHKRHSVLVIDHCRYWGGAETCLDNIFLDNQEQCDYFLLVDYPSEHNQKYHIAESNRLQRFKKTKNWIVKLESLSKNALFRRFVILLRALMLIPVLCRVRCDIVHFNLFRSNDLLDLIVCKLFRKKTVVHVRTPVSRMRIPTYLNPFIDAYVCVSHTTRNGYPNLPDAKTHVVYDGVRENEVVFCDRLHARRELKLPENHFIFASIGSYDPFKGHDSAIRAFAKLYQTQKDILLLVVGSPIPNFDGEKEYYYELCRQGGVENNVCFMTLPHPQMPVLYHAIDIALSLMKDGEAFGMIPVEAGLQECPCVGATLGAAHEIITDQSGWLVDSQCQNDIDECLKQVWMQEDTLKAKGKKAKEIILKKFISTKCNRRLLEIYDEIA